MGIWSRKWFPTRNFFCEVTIPPSQQENPRRPDGLSTRNHMTRLKIFFWAESDLTWLHLFEYNFEIFFLEFGFDFENRSLGAKCRYEIFFVAKMVLIELAQKKTRYNFYCGENALRKVGEALWNKLEKKEANKTSLYWKRNCTPPNVDLRLRVRFWDGHRNAFVCTRSPKKNSYYKRCKVWKTPVPLWTSIDACFFSTSVFNACALNYLYSLSKIREFKTVIAIRSRTIIKKFLWTQIQQTIDENASMHCVGNLHPSLQLHNSKGTYKHNLF